MLVMITFFVILAVLMVLVVAAGQWSAGARGRRVIHERDVLVDRGPDVIEEEIIDDPYPRPAARRLVRRRRSY